jgi:hypothetical protein
MTKPFQRGKRPHKKKKTQWLKNISAQRRMLLREYRKRRMAFLKNNPACRECGRSKGLSIHHSRGRAGSLMLDEKFWIVLCWAHHRQVHDNPDWARSKGYLAQRGQWNNPRIWWDEQTTTKKDNT